MSMGGCAESLNFRERADSISVMRSRCVVLLSFLSCIAAVAADHDWPTVGGDSGCARYSPLQQINRANVAQLRVSWTYHCGDKGDAGTIECTPIVIGGVIYLTTGGSKVV